MQELLDRLNRHWTLYVRDAAEKIQKLHSCHNVLLISTSCTHPNHYSNRYINHHSNHYSNHSGKYTSDGDADRYDDPTHSCVVPSELFSGDFNAGKLYEVCGVRVVSYYCRTLQIRNATVADSGEYQCCLSGGLCSNAIALLQVSSMPGESFYVPCH